MKRFILIVLAVFTLLGIGIFALLSYALEDFPIAPPERRAINKLVDGRTFNFVLWETEALLGKASAGLVSGADYLTLAQQKQLVKDYLSVVGEVGQIDRQLEQIFALSAEPQTESAELQQRLAAKRAELRRLQPVAENVLETQVSAVLNDADLAVLGGTWPPVAGRITPLPLMLIVSARDSIGQKYAFPLEQGMSVPDRDALENAIHDQLNLSALVVPIGGLGIYPAMIMETGSLPFLADTYAHEWTHHWLTLHPLGISYAKSGALRTMNETTASVVGQEIGRKVIARYYPELVPPLPLPPSDNDQPTPKPQPEDPDRFDFGQTLNDTRVHVDELIAAGKIDEAEAYMEQRRQLFVENGYLIRKLNQAYFAFHGGYATTPGAQGSDPVGPAVVALREQNDSLSSFLREIGKLNSFEQLQALLDQK